MANRELCTTEEELDEWEEWAALCLSEDEASEEEWAGLIDTDSEVD